MTEEWKPVVGYEGLYEVSNLGRVKSLNYWGKPGKIGFLSSIKQGTGYYTVNLYKDKKMKLHHIHRLVAMAFIPNPDNLPQVNHKDEDKTNNCLDNLEWCDNRYNINYGSCPQKIGSALSKTIYQYTLDGKLVATYKSTHDVHRQTGYTQGCISECCRGICKQRYGYKWSYTEL